MPTTLIADLIEITAELTRVSPAEIKGHRRNMPFVRARHAVCYVARKQGVYSYPHIGRMLGGRDHSTIINGARKAEIIAERNPDYRALLEEIERMAAESNPYLRLWVERGDTVTVNIKMEPPAKEPKKRIARPKQLRPMFTEAPEKGDSILKHNAMIAEGSAALLAALQA